MSSPSGSSEVRNLQTCRPHLLCRVPTQCGKHHRNRSREPGSLVSPACSVAGSDSCSEASVSSPAPSRRWTEPAAPGRSFQAPSGVGLPQLGAARAYWASLGSAGPWEWVGSGKTTTRKTPVRLDSSCVALWQPPL